MRFKTFVIILSFFFLFSGCQTIKQKSDEIAEKENQKFGKLIGNEIIELKTELGNPDEDFVNEVGNKIFVYKNKKYGITCERKFEIDQKNIVISFTSSGCF
tara:strand:- start:3432 stop:3734 length:303 start_codon:yes stop_codon:yes gene_type:complete